MSSTVNYVRDARNAEQTGNRVHGAPVQVGTPLNGTARRDTELRGEPAFTAIACAIVLASMSVGAVIGIGLLKWAGAR